MAERRQIRWELADSPQPQGSLFEESIFEREPGRGEFRGMEFLHVKARTIINELKGGAPFGFRYTINPYRGCSHACSYCAWGETPILMADGRTKPLAKVEVGDLVYGTEVRGHYRRYVPTPVLDHWSTVKPAYRVLLADGTELISSGDHRFLTERGWKHVTGTEHGRSRRPHLTTGNRMIGVGRFADGPADDADYRAGYLCGMIRGDGHVGHHRYTKSNGRMWTHHGFRLALVDQEALDRAQQYLIGLGVPTAMRIFQQATPTRKEMRAISAQSLAAVARIEQIIEWPTRPAEQWARGFLAGIFDAEGSCSRGVFRISNTDDRLLEESAKWMRRFGFGVVIEDRGLENHLRDVRLVGGLRERLRFFHTVDPAITRKRTFDGLAVKGRADLDVVSIEPLGFDLPLYDITTGTGDFVANGVISHNCFARPTHTYLDLDADRDFERSIVVKVNAVERLRHELDPRRWAGEHIAMGTNTDPYQRCEGKYRLTRGIVETLAEHGNPFSILTKSTLILRDLDVLAEAAKHTSVRVNFSIGTLDEAVWHTTEPGTPHPLRRVRAVQQLNEAGVECGVLAAPILPGLSDGPEQLEAVVRACVEAGAVSISTVLLHLRPGVKEVFMSRLAETHPHLVDDYRRRYGSRSYAPKTDQQAVAATVRGLVRRFGGLPAARLDVRHHTGHDVPPPPTAPTVAPAIQLELM